jgi:flagellar motility protein MotE (MotC chaperone)
MTKRWMSGNGFIVALAAMAQAIIAPAHAAGSQVPALPAPPLLEPLADRLLITGSTDAADKARTASDYCKALSDVAGEARLKWQADQLEKLGASVREATAELEAKRAELELWIKRRDEFVNKATASLTEIFKLMKPDAAAAQLDEVDDVTAAAILLKLQPRVSSRIFNELPSKRAARLVAVMSGAAKYRSAAEASQ